MATEGYVDVPPAGAEGTGDPNAPTGGESTGGSEGGGGGDPTSVLAQAAAAQALKDQLAALQATDPTFIVQLLGGQLGQPGQQPQQQQQPGTPFIPTAGGPNGTAASPFTMVVQKEPRKHTTITNPFEAMFELGDADGKKQYNKAVEADKDHVRFDITVENSKLLLDLLTDLATSYTTGGSTSTSPPLGPEGPTRTPRSFPRASSWPASI